MSPELLRSTIFDLADVSDLTPEILEASLYYSGVEFPSVSVEHYFENTDHGFSHSQAVWNRCQEIIDQSPQLWSLAKIQVGCKKIYAKKVLLLASIFHDLGRFIGAEFETHEKIGAELALEITAGNCLAESLFDAIVHHDYFCSIIDGCGIPINSIFPLSEIFRLADKTSIAPKDEIRRYHQTGKRLAPDLPLFDPTITNEVRFNFKSSLPKGDQLSWFLMIFALQSTDFLFGDTRDAYAYWARGKKVALETIGDLCREDEYLNGQIPVDPEAAKAVVVSFCQKYKLIIGT